MALPRKRKIWIWNLGFSMIQCISSSLLLMLLHGLCPGHSASLVVKTTMFPKKNLSIKFSSNASKYPDTSIITTILYSNTDSTPIELDTTQSIMAITRSATEFPDELGTVNTAHSTIMPITETEITNFYLLNATSSAVTDQYDTNTESGETYIDKETTKSNLSEEAVVSQSNNEFANTYYDIEGKYSKVIVTNVYRQREPSSVPETNHICARKCITGAQPMKCYYRFEMEWYFTMSKACFNCSTNASDCDRTHCIPADGIKRPVVTINRQMPGPSVEVCLGDNIIVDLVNNMMEETTSIHWHGHHQRGTPYMDGVPYVTQCPIPPKSSFRYRYRADTPGTHFWHSHTGCQRADGAYGALIVHVPQLQDPHAWLFDMDLIDHTIQIIDWGYELGITKFLAHHHADGDNKPKTLLVNGRGMKVGETNATPAIFTVTQSYRYRFRLINSGFLNCPIEMSVDNHTLLIISSDGSDIHPVPATSLVSYAGERFDFILVANQSISNYWMRFRGLMDCDDRFMKAHQVAVLHYEGSSVNKMPLGEVKYEASHRHGQQVNTLNVGPDTAQSLVISELDAIAQDDESLKPKPDMTLYLSYDFYDLDNPHYHKPTLYGFYNVTDPSQRLFTPQLNYISMKLLPFPLLSQHESLKPNMLCNHSTVDGCKGKYCECTHVIDVPLNSVLELILVDKGMTYNANHPFHLHGHAFRVIAMGRLGNFTTVEDVKELDRQGGIKRKLKGAPIKDTVTVPDGGYTVLRVYASNPGYWLFHCHIEFHVELGMAVVFKVGDHSDFPSIPQGFPRCNDWLPEDPDNNLLLDAEELIHTAMDKKLLKLNAVSESHTHTPTAVLLVVFILLCIDIWLQYAC